MVEEMPVSKAIHLGCKHISLPAGMFMLAKYKLSAVLICACKVFFFFFFFQIA